MKKALTVSNIQSQRVERVPFEGEFYQAFGSPQNRGVWSIWGPSGSGKSSFVMQTAKELARTYRVLYDVLEEDTDDSDFIDRVEMVGMADVAHNFHAVQYGYEELVNYLKNLRKSRRPQVVIIDSLTYFTKDFEKYLALKKMFKDILFIFTSHAKGKNPKEEIEIKVMYDAKMKIYVSGYVASCKGRTIGPNGGQFIVWQEGYEKLRGASK